MPCKLALRRASDLVGRIHCGRRYHGMALVWHWRTTPPKSGQVVDEQNGNLHEVDVYSTRTWGEECVSKDDNDNEVGILLLIMGV